MADMVVDREALFDALAAQLAAVVKANVPELVSCTRRVRPQSQVPPEEQPEIQVAVGPSSPANVPGLPTVQRLTAILYVYAYDPGLADPGAKHGSLLNRLIKGVELALLRQPGEGVGDLGEPGSEFQTTLGGRVS